MHEQVHTDRFNYVSCQKKRLNGTDADCIYSFYIDFRDQNAMVLVSVSLRAYFESEVTSNMPSEFKLLFRKLYFC